jgi:hypothetical protein
VLSMVVGAYVFIEAHIRSCCAVLYAVLCCCASPCDLHFL